MSQTFRGGDYLIFQLESGYGLMRVLAIENATEGEESETVWHLCVYEELFPAVESAEEALAQAGFLHASKPHIALTNRAFERAPVARIGYRPVSDDELAAYRQWQEGVDRHVFDRSVPLLLGMR
jgi:hypothetical protein